jgi:hypothetical protein
MERLYLACSRCTWHPRRVQPDSPAATGSPAVLARALQTVTLARRHHTCAGDDLGDLWSDLGNRWLSGCGLALGAVKIVRWHDGNCGAASRAMRAGAPMLAPTRPTSPDGFRLAPAH